ncbi:MAG: 6-carboxytetrahydropterin synthase [Bacteriovorax sp.]|nr:6-carboxytetrahydropterin synthase [Bacteriovorax sp.]
MHKLVMQSAIRKIHFCYGHRVMNHESKCSSLHGHNGVIWVHVTPIKELDSLGRVIDFSVVKSAIGGWVLDHWDHTMIIFKEDTKTIELLNLAPSYKTIFVLDKNPTAENMANFLLWEVCPKLLKGKGIVVHKIVFWETENCYVEESLDPTLIEVLELYA